MHHFENAADQRRVHRGNPAPVISQGSRQLPLDGIARLADRPLPAWMVMRRPTNRSGADQGLVTTVLIPRVVGDDEG